MVDWRSTAWLHVSNTISGIWIPNNILLFNLKNLISASFFHLSIYLSMKWYITYMHNFKYIKQKISKYIILDFSYICVYVCVYVYVYTHQKTLHRGNHYGYDFTQWNSSALYYCNSGGYIRTERRPYTVFQIKMAHQVGIVTCES